MRIAHAAVAAVYSLSLLSQYASADFDFQPKLTNNQVATGGTDDENGLRVDSLRVGSYEFGETAGDPYNIGDPGFNTNGATAFTGGSQLRFAALSVGGVYLSRWDGTGTPNFTAAPAGVSLSLSGSPVRFLTYTPTAAVNTPATSSDLLIGTFSSNGALHIHLGSSIATTDASGVVPDGAYLISFQLTNPGTGAASSDPLYIVYNNNLSDDQADAAVAAVQSRYVPEPATLGLMAVGGLLLGRRRRGAAV